MVSGNPTLNGVTINGVLDVGNTYNAASLTVTNGLILNGTCYVGNPTNGSYGAIGFAGSQTLGGNGTVVFGNYGQPSANELWLVNAGTTLTIGSGITVEGQNGTIGYSSWFGGPQNVGVINQGTISANVSGGTIYVVAQPFTNQGLVESPLGTLNLSGTLTTAGLGSMKSGNGPLALSGVLTNNGTTLVLNGATNLLKLQGGTILGGSIATANGAALIVSSGTLNGVTINGVLDVGNTYNAASLTVTNGLILNGTCYVGNPTNGSYGAIGFAGSQTLGGNGTVVFGNYGQPSANELWLVNAGTTLTIGSGITVEGQNGTIGYSSWFGGPQNVGVINQGTISANVSGGTIYVVAQPFTNEGVVSAAGGNIALPTEFQSTGTLGSGQWRSIECVPQLPSTSGNIVALAGGTVVIPTYLPQRANYLSSQVGGVVEISGSLLGNTMNLGQYEPLGATILNGSGTASSPQLLDVMGADEGTSQLGCIHNFNYGTLILTNHTYVELINQYQNSGTTGPEALYVNSLIVPSGCTLNMTGFHVYARATLISGTILNGMVTQIPSTGPIGFSNPTLGDISTAGQLEQWTFFARAGQFYTVLVDPGNDVGATPPLGFVQVQVLNTNGVLIASATNSASGAGVLLPSIAITNDGTYSVNVHASSIAPGGTGYYLVTVWQTTPNVFPLTLNTIVNGSIKSPYGSMDFRCSFQRRGPAPLG